MNGYRWTTHVGLGGLGFHAPGHVRRRDAGLRPRRRRATGGVGVDRRDDCLDHGGRGVPVHRSSNFDWDLVESPSVGKFPIRPGGVHGVKLLLKSVMLGLALLALSACGGMPAPTPWSDSAANRLELGSGVVVTFVEGLTPEMPGRVAYITHVASGSQAILDSEGKVVQRHDGRADGASRLDTVLGNGAAVALVMQRLTNGGDVSPRPHTIGWVPFAQFGSIRYVRTWHSTGEGNLRDEPDLAAEDLGPELYRVAFRGSGYAGPYYRYQDGDATHLNPGTPVHAVKGYSPEFRLGTLEDGRPTLYEADTNPSAITGEDLLDIRGKVKAVDVLDDDDAMTILGTMDDEGTIERFVASVLEAPVDQSSRDHDGPRYFLGIRLADGTSVVRAFWLETGELSRGIMTDPVVTLSVWLEIPDEHRPVGTDGGPRISERLAGRMGLAYLSFNVPELVVTGKPHSPTVRLMRRHEFDAMQGASAWTRLPDPLVWVVEARGSWREGGITPEEARRNLSVGLVAFDADTGSMYGASYRNEPLLERSENPSDAFQPNDGDSGVVATVEGKDVTSGDVRRWAAFWMEMDSSLTSDDATHKTIVHVIDSFIEQAEVERRQLTPTREEAADYMRRHREPCLGEHGAGCREGVARLGFDPNSDEYWENIALPEYGKALGEIKLFHAVIKEKGLEGASNDEPAALRNALPGERRENAVIVWHDDDLERVYQSALQSK